jgi:hypothetical protein
LWSVTLFHVAPESSDHHIMEFVIQLMFYSSFS